MDRWLYDLLPADVSDEGIVAHYQEWRQQMESLASTAAQNARPAFNTEACWARFAVEKMRNLDVVFMRRSPDVAHDFLLPPAKDLDAPVSDTESDTDSQANSECRLPSEPSDADAYVDVQGREHTARAADDLSASKGEAASYPLLTHHNRTCHG